MVRKIDLKIIVDMFVRVLFFFELCGFNKFIIFENVDF